MCGMPLVTRQRMARAGPSVHLHLLGIEIAQAVQDINHTVPLVAGKRTIVRLYLDTEESPMCQLNSTLAIFLETK